MNWNGFTKKDWCIYILCCIIIFVICILGGCNTTRLRTDGRDIRKTDTYILGQLESSLSDFDERIERAINESNGIADEVERLDVYFTRYEEATLRLRDETRALRKQIKDLQKVDNNRPDTGGSVYIDKDGNTYITD